MLLVTSVIWGVAGPVIKFTLQYYPPLIFLTYRFFMSSLIAVPFIARDHRAAHMKSPKKIFNVLLYSVLAVPVTLGLLFYGFEKTTVLSGTLLMTIGPLLTIVLSALFFREHVTRIERAGITLAFFGSIITIVGPVIGGDGVSVGALEGNLLITAAVMLDTVAALMVKILNREDIPAALTSHASFLIGFLLFLPLTLAQYPPAVILKTIAEAPFVAHAGVLFMAILSGTLAYTLRNRAVKTIELSEAAVYGYLHPLWAAPLALLWLHERVTVPFVAGAMLISGGVILAERKKRKHRKQPRRYRASVV